MRSLTNAGLFFLFFFTACNNDPNLSSENDVDAARNFISSVLQADFDKATKYVLLDSLNKEYLEITERSFDQRMSAEDKRLYKESSINIHDVKQLNDSVTIVHYSNSFKKVRDSLKVVRINGQWLIDLKYSLAPNSSLP